MIMFSGIFYLLQFCCIFISFLFFLCNNDETKDFFQLTLYSIISPFKYHVFENIMENGAFAFLEQIFSKVFKT